MTSLLTTMFVSLFSSPRQPPGPSQPLPPHCTLKQSASCVTFSSYTPHEIVDPEVEESSLRTSRAFQLLRDELRHSVSSPPSPSSKQESKAHVADTLPCDNSNARTRGQFKPQRAQKGTSSYQLRQFAEATLGSGSLRKAVKLPEGEDLNEWLAVNGKEDYNRRKTRNILTRNSGRLLQSNQSALWLHHRVLLASKLSGDESYRRVSCKGRI